MDRHENKPTNHLKATMDLRAADLCDIERYFMEEGRSAFVYDEELDVFRFPEDGRFAFCREFANWELLRERGCLEF
jgi:hypothetical protein